MSRVKAVVGEERSWGQYREDKTFSQRYHVRAYEPHANGRLDFGGLLRYCEIIANEASAVAGFNSDWYVNRGESWVIFKQTLELATPVGIGDILGVQTWIRDYARVRANRDYLVWHADSGKIAARATATWAYVNRESQSPKRFPAEFTERLPIVPLSSLSPRFQWGLPYQAALPLSILRLTARYSETDTLKHVNNCVYADWLHEAALMSFQEWHAAIDPQLVLLTQSPLLPRRLQISYQHSALPGDEVIITSVPERISSRGIALKQTITRRDEAQTVLITAISEYLNTSVVG